MAEGTARMPAVVPLARRTILWASVVGILPGVFLLGGVFIALGDGSLVDGLLTSSVGALLGLLSELPILPLAWAQLRGLPRLVVEPSGLAIHHPAIFRRPVWIDRDCVHSVYFKMKPGVPGVGSVLLPDLSLLAETSNLLVVFTAPLPIGGDARRGMGLVNTLLRACGPTRITYARGFVADVEDADLATRAFAGWPTTSPVPQDVLEWLEGELPGRRRSAAPVSGGGSGGPAAPPPPRR